MTMHPLSSPTQTQRLGDDDWWTCSYWWSHTGRNGRRDNAATRPVGIRLSVFYTQACDRLLTDSIWGQLCWKLCVHRRRPSGSKFGDEQEGKPFPVLARAQQGPWTRKLRVIFTLHHPHNRRIKAPFCSLPWLPLSFQPHFWAFSSQRWAGSEINQSAQKTVQLQKTSYQTKWLPNEMESFSLPDVTLFF